MNDVEVYIQKLNEVYIKISCERHICAELNDTFSFFANAYKFHPLYKNKMWDGKIYLFDMRARQIYVGLLPHIINFCRNNGYTFKIDENLLNSKYSLDTEYYDVFVKNLGLPFELRDYQHAAIKHCIENKRALIVSPTASGKSSILYTLARWYEKQGLKKGILITDRTQLVEQMFSDFESYGWKDIDKYVKKQYSEIKNNNEPRFLTITTWQSVFSKNPSYFKDFDFVFMDEAHLAKAKSLTSIMTNLVNTEYRIGCTGSLDDIKVNKLVLEGLTGEVFRSTTTKELIDKGQLADIKIKCLILKYSEETRKLFKHSSKKDKKVKYQDEISFIVENKIRNDFIKKLALSLEGNTLILFNYVEKQGKILYQLLEKYASENKKIFFVHGGVEAKEREEVRRITEETEGTIIIASYGVFSTGTNIKRLNNIIFASPSKSKIRNLQSIGRGLRIGDKKTHVVLYDIVDDLRTGKTNNFCIQHFMERVKIYEDQKFPYKFYHFNINA